MTGAEAAQVVIIGTIEWDTHAGQLRAQWTALDALVAHSRTGSGRFGKKRWS